MSSAPTDTRTAILEAAWQRLVEHGPDALKLGQVAEDAGVSRQAIYLHFGSRGDVLLSLVSYIDEKLALGSYFDELPATDDPVERVCNSLRVTARYAPQIQEVALAFELASHRDPDIAAAFEDRMKQRRDGLRELVSAAAESGRIASGWSVEQVVEVLWALGRPTFYGSLVTERGWSTDDFERLLVQTFTRTFVAP